MRFFERDAVERRFIDLESSVLARFLARYYEWQAPSSRGVTDNDIEILYRVTALFHDGLCEREPIWDSTYPPSEPVLMIGTPGHLRPQSEQIGHLCHGDHLFTMMPSSKAHDVLQT